MNLLTNKGHGFAKRFKVANVQDSISVPSRCFKKELTSIDQLNSIHSSILDKT